MIFLQNLWSTPLFKWWDLGSWKCPMMLTLYQYILKGSAAQLWPRLRNPWPKVFFRQPVFLPPSSPPLPCHPPPNRRWEGWEVEGWMEGGRMVDGRRPSVMASLTEVRAVPRTLQTITLFGNKGLQFGCWPIGWFCEGFELTQGGSVIK